MDTGEKSLSLLLHRLNVSYTATAVYSVVIYISNERAQVDLSTNLYNFAVLLPQNPAPFWDKKIHFVKFIENALV